MNWLILKRQYTLKKYLSVVAITAGIIVCTLATASLEKVWIFVRKTHARFYFAGKWKNIYTRRGQSTLPRIADRHFDVDSGADNLFVFGDLSGTTLRSTREASTRGDVLYCECIMVGVSSLKESFLACNLLAIFHVYGSGHLAEYHRIFACRSTRIVWSFVGNFPFVGKAFRCLRNAVSLSFFFPFKRMTIALFLDGCAFDLSTKWIHSLTRWRSHWW